MKEIKDRIDGDWYQMNEEEQEEYCKQLEDSFWVQIPKKFIPDDYKIGD